MGMKIGGEPSMTLAEFHELVGKCSDQEIDRLKSRYRRYCRWHRQVFIDVLKGKFVDDEEFSRTALNARDEASRNGQTSAAVPDNESRQRRSGLSRTNNRKLIKLATRIQFLRLTGGAGKIKSGPKVDPSPLPSDSSELLKPALAYELLAKTMAPWGVAKDAIRQEHTPFQKYE